MERKIGIIDADLIDNGTRHPNLALMKIAGYFKNKGAEVKLIYSYEEVEGYDEIYMSKVFSYTRVPEKILGLNNIKIGGTGFFEDGGENLPTDIEHHMPYYDLYNEYIKEKKNEGEKSSKYLDYEAYSIGFMTRGCFRKCEFCVNKKYDHVFSHSPISEFLDADRPYIYLWDDNILGYSRWKEVLLSLEKTGKPFQFRQGIDLRLMTDEKAKVFSKLKYKGDFIFAFDHLKDKYIIEEKIQLWKRHFAKVSKMYVLCAFESQDEKDIESVFIRIKILMKYGSLPYIMRYEDYKNSRFRGIYTELARWCNQPQFFKKKSFREFCTANQEYKKRKEENCTSFQSMLDFEKEFPEIAKKYFDLKYEEENIYVRQYGYGRKYANKLNCNYCEKKGLSLKHLIESGANDKLIELYFTKELDLLCTEYRNSKCKNNSRRAAEYLYNLILETPISRIIEILRMSENREKVTKENIPQFSDEVVVFNNLPGILCNPNKKEYNFIDLGGLLEIESEKEEKTKVAKQKYGENHAKLACQLDIVQIVKSGVESKVRITKIGEKFDKEVGNRREEMFAKLTLRIPIIQNAFIDQAPSLDVDMGILSKETQKRRRSNVETMVKLVTKYIINSDYVSG